MARATNSRSRRDNFYEHYKTHPGELKGKSVDEAYAAMRREVERKQRGGANPGDKNFVGPVARRVAARNEKPPATVPRRRSVEVGGGQFSRGAKLTLPGGPSKESGHGFGGYGVTPQKVKNAMHDFNDRAQTTVNKAHNDIAGKIKAVERRVRRNYAKF